MVVEVVETVLKRDRLIVLSGLAIIVGLAWAYMVYLALDMQKMTMEMTMPRMQMWGIVDFGMMFIMWSVMMVAMMIPSATPMILTFATLKRQRQKEQSPLLPIALFVLGYLIIWFTFSALATVAQWVLHSTALLSPMMVSSSPILGGVLLVAAGVFQWTPLKHACLGHCRTPIGYFMTEWQEGNRGALMMGLQHGKFCTGCCWLTMALLFVAGVMNLLWVAVIAGFVLIEKIAPAGGWVSRVAGLLLVGWGAWMIVGFL